MIAQINIKNVDKLKAINNQMGVAINELDKKDSLDAQEGISFFSNELIKLLHRMGLTQNDKQNETKETK